MLLFLPPSLGLLGLEEKEGGNGETYKRLDEFVKKN
jgi:hypothetical protein